MTASTSDAGSVALWRRQGILSALAVAAFAAVAVLNARVVDAHREAVARARLLLPAADTTGLEIALLAATIATVALLGAACLHALRIARLTFRRGETE